MRFSLQDNELVYPNPGEFVTYGGTWAGQSPTFDSSIVPGCSDDDMGMSSVTLQSNGETSTEPVPSGTSLNTPPASGTPAVPGETTQETPEETPEETQEQSPEDAPAEAPEELPAGTSEGSQAPAPGAYPTQSGQLQSDNTNEEPQNGGAAEVPAPPPSGDVNNANANLGGFPSVTSVSPPCEKSGGRGAGRPKGGKGRGRRGRRSGRG